MVKIVVVFIIAAGLFVGGLSGYIAAKHRDRCIAEGVNTMERAIKEAARTGSAVTIDGHRVFVYMEERKDGIVLYRFRREI